MKKCLSLVLSLLIFFTVFSFSEIVNAEMNYEAQNEKELIQTQTVNDELVLNQSEEVVPFKNGDGEGAFELGFLVAHGLLLAPYTEWHQGSFESSAMSLVGHYYKHGDEVGATSASSYLNKAIEFRRTAKKGVKPSNVSGEVEGVKRYRKNGKYIDLAPNGKIVSFGTTN